MKVTGFKPKCITSISGIEHWFPTDEIITVNFPSKIFTKPKKKLFLDAMENGDFCWSKTDDIKICVGGKQKIKVNLVDQFGEVVTDYEVTIP